MDLYYLSSDIRLAAALAEASIAPIRTRLNNKDPFKKQALKSALDWEQRGGEVRKAGRQGRKACSSSIAGRACSLRIVGRGLFGEFHFCDGL